MKDVRCGIAIACAAFSIVGVQHARGSGAPSQDFVPDARGQGFGSALTALADGPTTVWWNPAALGVLDCSSAGFHSARPFFNSVEYDAYSMSAFLGGLGIGAHWSKVDFGPNLFRPEKHSTETLTTVGAGYDLASALLPGIRGLDASLGAAIKWFDLYSPFRTADEGEAWDADIAFLLGMELPFHAAGTGERDSRLRSSISYVRRNALDHSVHYTGNPGSDPLRVRDVIGVGIEAAFLESRFGPALSLRSEFDRHSTSPYFEVPLHHFGGEASLLEVVFFRAGRTEYAYNPRPADANFPATYFATWFGWGVGLDHESYRPSSTLRRVGFRYDQAMSENNDSPPHHSVSAWIALN